MSSQSWTFFQAFLKSPRVVASMIPSSPFLERRVVEAARLSTASAAVELGSGTGGTTRALLAALGPQSRLLAIERTEEFVTALTRIGDPRLEVVHGCASTVVAELARRGLRAVDAVISGIPFSTMPPDLARSIIEEIHRALTPRGRFVAYQFTDRVAEYARPVFGRPRVQHELRNVPPLRIYTWEKRADTAAA
jgi:phospholipid N-methyltransferase